MYQKPQLKRLNYIHILNIFLIASSDISAVKNLTVGTMHLRDLVSLLNSEPLHSVMARCYMFNSTQIPTINRWE